MTIINILLMSGTIFGGLIFIIGILIPYAGEGHELIIAVGATLFLPCLGLSCFLDSSPEDFDKQSKQTELECPLSLTNENYYELCR